MAKGKYEKWLEEDSLALLGAWARSGLTQEQIAKNMEYPYPHSKSGLKSIRLFRLP